MTDTTQSEGLLPEQRHRDAAEATWVDLANADHGTGRASKVHLALVQAFARFERDHLATADAREGDDALRDKNDESKGSSHRLKIVAKMLEAIDPECFSENRPALADFARVIIEVAATEIQAFLATPSAPRPDAGEVERLREGIATAIGKADIDFLRDLSARMHRFATPKIGFDQGDTDQLNALASRLAALRTPAAGVEGEMAAERLRQVQEEGFSAERDDAYTDYSLARAAAAYAMIAGWPDEVERSVAETTFPDGHGLTHKMLQLWPGSWDPTWLKPKTRRADLVRAGALIIAEIERLDREAARG